MLSVTGYEYLINKFKEIPVDIPTTMTIEELAGWLEGYKACLDNVLGVLKEMQAKAGIR